MVSVADLGIHCEGSHMRHAQLLSILLVGTSFFAGTEAQAKEFCISNSDELRDAIDYAHTVDESSVILVKEGLYQLDGRGGALQGDTVIRGGYSPLLADSCSTQVRDARKTTIQLSPQASGPFELDVTDDLLVEAITFTTSTGATIDAVNSDSATLILENTVWRRTAVSGTAPTLRVTQHESSKLLVFRLLNSDLSGAPQGQTVCQVLVGPQAGQPQDTIEATFVNNTIANNAGTGICLRHVDEAKLVNNILWGNSAAGIQDLDTFGQPSPIALRHNTLQASDEFNLGNVTESLNNSTADPLFVSATNLRLTQNSDAVNSGTVSPVSIPKVDVVGETREVGAAIDRGAYESTFAPGGVIFVNTTKDGNLVGNEKSLRAAIDEANSDADFDVIRFAITDGAVVCPKNIALASGPLPTIITPIAIDGYSQDESRTNKADVGFDGKLCVSVTGSATNYALKTSGVNARLDVSGLIFNGFQTAIAIEGGSQHRVRGNIIGTVQQGVGTGVRQSLAGGNAFIGGADKADRNVISGTLTAISLLGAGSNVVGNLIGAGTSGLGMNGVINAANFFGIDLQGSNNYVAGNTISKNLAAGITVSGGNNNVTDNLIGLTDGKSCGDPCMPALGNGTGIKLTAGPNFVSNNEIAYNSDRGVVVAGGKGNNVGGNLIYANTGLGIDLGDDKVVEPVDADYGEPVTAPNRGLNFPELTAALGSVNFPTSAVVAGSLSSTKGSYTVRYFAVDQCDSPTDHGEGDELVGSLTVTITNGDEANGINGSVSVGSPVTSTRSLDGRFITALARDTSGNTSEFSLCVPVQLAVANQPPVVEDQRFVVQKVLVPDPDPLKPGAWIYPLNQVLAAIAANDMESPDELTYAVKAGGVAPFAVDASTGEISLTAEPNFEGCLVYAFEVTVKDKANLTDKATITFVADREFSDGFEDGFAPAPQCAFVP